ncbi:hypothetical protein [Rhodococcoides fascians]|uniref:hypothetical protein n=1 Tax=Rhodococcoides fascians TaxID=1828 RepID=UPI00278A89C1|nr:hypothetical protein [Rhodococcus fascians]MDQ0284782.1 DNA topoisomerase IB [Rhodococcus fascians]
METSAATNSEDIAEVLAEKVVGDVPGTAPSSRDLWCTEDDLVEDGYRREALVELFGNTTEGPDGIVGWTAASVAKIEELVLEPAYRLVADSFQSFDDAGTMQARVGYARW